MTLDCQCKMMDETRKSTANDPLDHPRSARGRHPRRSGRAAGASRGAVVRHRDGEVVVLFHKVVDALDVTVGVVALAPGPAGFLAVQVGGAVVQPPVLLRLCFHFSAVHHLRWIEKGGPVPTVGLRSPREVGTQRLELKMTSLNRCEAMKSDLRRGEVVMEAC